MTEQEPARDERGPSRGQVEQAPRPRDEVATGASKPGDPDVSAGPPLLQVISPDATPEEVAALVAVFSALGGGEPAPEPPRSEWAAPARRMRAALPHGRDGWRASALPR
ncbi:MAG TPA: acyl-CoA carboxylase subunit epsilon [Nocardioides sp.]|nr:acyl-CoA carboxylase subunit epsilon [Nocardioides sp.]